MSSRIKTAVSLSFEEFSLHGGATASHRDGWGIAYYEEKDVLLIKEPRSASQSKCARFVKTHHFKSDLVVSHIRKATQGNRTLRNTQPFSRELAGRMHLFAHNGDLTEVQKHFFLKRYQPVGETDSEYAFCALLASLQEVWLSSTTPSLEQRLSVISSFAKKIAALGPANFIYTDGEFVFAHGNYRTQADGQIAPPGLWMLSRRCAAGSSKLAGVVINTEAGLAKEKNWQEVVLIASVPLSDEEWVPLRAGEMAVLNQGKLIRRV